MENKKQGFTIIELMVTMAIIGMIVALITISFSGAKAKSRDSRRMEDLKQISNALNLYYSVHRNFPTANPVIHLDGADTISTSLINENFMPAAITDPLDSGNYIYQYFSSSGLDYVLSFYLETGSIQGYSVGAHTMQP